MNNTWKCFVRKNYINWPVALTSKTVLYRPEFNFFVIKLKIPYLLDFTGVDLFSLFEENELKRLREDPSTYLFFDYLAEGTSYKWMNYYDTIEKSALRYNIPFYKIIYASSNIKEAESYSQWCIEKQQQEQFKILSFNFWDGVFQNEMGKDVSLDETVTHLRNNLPKYFLCLNRRKRPYRLLALLKLFESGVFDKGIVSCDRLKKTDFEDLNWHLNHIFNEQLDKKVWKSLAKQTPITVDYTDFTVNWAYTMPDDLFNNTLFSLVNETLIEEIWTNTGLSLFYSEKSFKPMLYNQPILIFGQSGCNKGLETLGYRAYDKYFDLSFDNELNTIRRIEGVVSETKRICDMLDSLSPESRIEWFLQDRETLEYNKEILKSQKYNVQQVTNLFKILEEENK